MKRKKVDAHSEKKIITGLVVSKDFLAQAAPVLDPRLFEAEHFAQIARWCLKYWDRYRKAPKDYIESMYHSWVERGQAKEEVVEAVHDILEDLSEEYESGAELNVSYLVDVLGEFIALRNLENTKEELEDALLEKDQERAESAIAQYRTVSVGSGNGVDVLNDDEAWDLAYSEQQESLIRFGHKAADRFFGHALVRDGLVGILAPEKRGKTWWCVEFAMRALMNRRKVALFEVGDMSQSQILRRLGTRLSNRPSFKKDLGELDVPVSCTRKGNDVEAEYKCVQLDHVANAKASKKAVKRFLRRTGLSNQSSFFRLSVHPNSTINVAGIEGILEMWSHEGFVPDVTLIDYPDILAPEPGTEHMQQRDQINQTWKALRRLSQEWHNLVIAPTQANSASYDTDVLDMRNFSEDKRKFAHVTGMLGLNQTPEEKRNSLMRLNWIVLRESQFEIEQCLRVLQCLTIGRAYCCSTL